MSHATIPLNKILQKIGERKSHIEQLNHSRLSACDAQVDNRFFATETPSYVKATACHAEGTLGYFLVENGVAW